MATDRVGADAQPLSDRLVVEPLGERDEDVPFAWRELLQAVPLSYFPHPSCPGSFDQRQGIPRQNQWDAGRHVSDRRGDVARR